MGGEDVGHFVERRDEPEDLAVEFGAFTKRVDGGIAGGHGGLDEDAAIDGEAGILGYVSIGADAYGHDHEGGFQDLAIGEFDAFDAGGAEDGFGVRAGQDFDAACFKVLLEEETGCGVELAFHEGGHKVDDGNVHAAFGEACGSFETEEAAADDDGFAARLGGEDHGLHVVEIAVGENAGQGVAGNRNDHRHRAGRDDELVVVRGDPVLGGNGAGVAVNLRDLGTFVERHAVLDVPAVAVDDDVVEGFLTREKWRQHDAVVVDARFGVENRYVVGAGVLVEQTFEGATRRHAVADDDELLLAGRADHSAATAGDLWRS